MRELLPSRASDRTSSFLFKHYGVNEGAGVREAEFVHYGHSCCWAGVLLYGNHTYSEMDWLIGETIHSEAYA